MAPKKPIKAPAHLTEATQKWFEAVVDGYDLEQHHVRLLTLAGEAWDRSQQAREALAEHGLTFVDRFGRRTLGPKWQSNATVASPSRGWFASLDLDVDPPDPPQQQVAGRKR